MGRARARRIPAQLVEDEDYQLRHERVAGIDIAKAKADVCTRLPPVREGGRRTSARWQSGCWRTGWSWWSWSRPRITCEVRVHEFKWEALPEVRLMP